MFRAAREKLGANVRAARAELGLSQEELAARCGLHRTYVGGIERGERNVSFENLLRLAGALRIKPVALFDGVHSLPAKRTEPVKQ